MQVSRVFPIIDANTGHIQFRVDGRWRQYYTDRPRTLLRMLARSTRPPRFDAPGARLVLTVPANRVASGRDIAFSLDEFLGAPRLTRLEGDGDPLPRPADAPYRV